MHSLFIFTILMSIRLIFLIVLYGQRLVSDILFLRCERNIALIDSDGHAL